jgi:hemerythrin-like domain-containing protein
LQEIAMTAMPLARTAAPTRAAVRSPQPFEVLDACHQQILTALDRMHELVEHLEAHGVDATAQGMAKDIYIFFNETARHHHLDEEKHVFPALLNSGDEALVRHVLHLQQDHGWIEEDWLELAPQFEAMAAGYCWYNIDQLNHALPVFTALYHDHMALEESLAYPEAKARIAKWELQGMGREMAQRRREPSASQRQSD